MSTIISEVMEQILEEENLGRTDEQARRILDEHNKSQKRLDQQFRDWEEAA